MSSAKDSGKPKGSGRKKPRRSRQKPIDFPGFPPENMRALAKGKAVDFNRRPNKDVFDQMEAMLGHIHKRQDPRRVVDTMRFCFGSGNAMFRADRYLLEKLGLGRLDALFFSLIPEITRCTESTSYGAHPPIGRLEEAAAYLVSNFIGLQDEYFYLFCVNMHGRQKAKVLLNAGIEDRALLSISKLITEILRADPAGVIVAHNHPNGTLHPSQADLQCTEEIIQSVTVLGIPLLDHVIVADNRAISIRDNGFFPERVWLEQDPDNPLLRNWLTPVPPKPERKPRELSPEEKAAAREKAIQSARRKRTKQLEHARSEYRRHTKEAERALRVYQNLLAIDARDREK